MSKIRGIAIFKKGVFQIGGTSERKPSGPSVPSAWTIAINDWTLQIVVKCTAKDYRRDALNSSRRSYKVATDEHFTDSRSSHSTVSGTDEG